MKDSPSDILKQFSDMLKKRLVPAAAHSYYLKWLQYSLDYCAKYNLLDKASKNWNFDITSPFSTFCGSITIRKDVL